MIPPRILAAVAVLWALIAPAHAQQNQCRTSPVGASTSYCASEAFVTKSATKAWVKFTGSSTNGPQTINSAFNVSAVTRTGLGDYTITFSPTPFASADYVCTGSEIVGVSFGFIVFGTNLAGSINTGFITFSGGSPAGFDPANGLIACEGVQ